MYLDGTHKLEDVKCNMLPRYIEENVKFDNFGNVLMTTDNQVVFPLLWVFGSHVQPDKNKFFVVEIELIDTDTMEILCLRYVSLVKFTPTLYPKLYAGVYALLASKLQPILMPGGRQLLCDEM